MIIKWCLCLRGLLLHEVQTERWWGTFAAKASNPICGPRAPAGGSAAALGPCTGESVLGPPLPITTLLYAVWRICTVLWSRGGGSAPPGYGDSAGDQCYRRDFFFFLEHTPNDSPGWGLSTGQARVKFNVTVRKIHFKTLAAGRKWALMSVMTAFRDIIYHQGNDYQDYSTKNKPSQTLLTLILRYIHCRISDTLL